MHGIGNDFVIVDLTGDSKLETDWATVAQKLCDRHYGVGGDGLLLVIADEEVPYQMRMLNPDGSESEMCGNGLRCFGQYLYETGKIQVGTTQVRTGAGILVVTIHGDGTCSVDMGQAILEPEKIGMRWITGESFINQPIGAGYFGTAISMGNPHLVIFTEDVSKVDLEHLGKELETHPYFPNRVNVHFVQVVDRTHLIQRTWERGAGITLACGTGACACAVASFLEGRSEREVEIKLPGGSLMLNYKEDGHVVKTGSATTVFSGTLSPAFLDSLASA